MNRARTLLATAFLLSFAFAGCIGDSDPSADPNSSQGSSGESLTLSRALTSIHIDDGETIDVRAVDNQGQAVSVNISGPSDCATATVSGSRITIDAGNATCTTAFTISAPDIGMEKSLEVQVLDPLSMDIGDGLLIKFWNIYSWAFEDSCVFCEPTDEIRFLNPQLMPDGYHSLGTMFVQWYGDPGNKPTTARTVIAKDSLETGALAPPENYVWAWQSDGTHHHQGSVWIPICPDGYAALGALGVGGHNKPNTDAMRCVREDFTAVGQLGPKWKASYQSGHDMVLRTIADPLALEHDEDRVPLDTRHKISCGDDSTASCDTAWPAVNKLLIPIPIVERTENVDVDVQLTGYKPLDNKIPRFHSAVRMPWVMIPAALKESHIDQMANTPFYKVYRTETYTTMQDGIIDNRQGSNDVTKDFAITTGFSNTQTDEFHQDIGISITHEASWGLGSTSVELSYSFGWSSETSSTYGEETSSATGFTIPAGTYAQIVQVHTKFAAQDGLGRIMDAQIEGGSSEIKYLQYPLPA